MDADLVDGAAVEGRFTVTVESVPGVLAPVQEPPQPARLPQPTRHQPVLASAAVLVSLARSDAVDVEPHARRAEGRGQHVPVAVVVPRMVELIVK